MNTPQVYEFNDYKDYLHALVESQKTSPGLKVRWSKAMKSPPSFLSQVLHGTVNLTPDHALRLTRHWEMTESERDHFMDLVDLARAGSPELQNLLQNRLRDRKRRQSDLADRFVKPKLESSEAQWSYYTAWHLGAIHMLVTISRYRKSQAIAERLQLPLSFVESGLKQLQEIGLVENSRDEWRATKNSIHLSKDSLASAPNHQIWRQRAAQSMYAKSEQALHYTGLHTLAWKDIARIREILLGGIEKSRAVIEPSAEEELICICCDLFLV